MQPSTNDADGRLDRLERTLWAMFRDGSVRGVLWSDEVVQSVCTMRTERAAREMRHPTSSELGHG